mmetsp:Transcript_3101/g.7184  ORF Transcript_3101/g.7184 Transcript_3101/m.7184 type:complete len:568 (-) Transcript_3101:663-2366(-)
MLLPLPRQVARGPVRQERHDLDSRRHPRVRRERRIGLARQGADGAPVKLAPGPAEDVHEPDHSDGVAGAGGNQGLDGTECLEGVDLDVEPVGAAAVRRRSLTLRLLLLTLPSLVIDPPRQLGHDPDRHGAVPSPKPVRDHVQVRPRRTPALDPRQPARHGVGTAAHVRVGDARREYPDAPLGRPDGARDGRLERGADGGQGLEDPPGEVVGGRRVVRDGSRRGIGGRRARGGGGVLLQQILHGSLRHAVVACRQAYPPERVDRPPSPPLAEVVRPELAEGRVRPLPQSVPVHALRAQQVGEDVRRRLGRERRAESAPSRLALWGTRLGLGQLLPALCGRRRGGEAALGPARVGEEDHQGLPVGRRRGARLPELGALLGREGGVVRAQAVDEPERLESGRQGTGVVEVAGSGSLRRQRPLPARGLDGPLLPPPPEVRHHVPEQQLGYVPARRGEAGRAVARAGVGVPLQEEPAQPDHVQRVRLVDGRGHGRSSRTLGPRDRRRRPYARRAAPCVDVPCDLPPDAPEELVAEPASPGVLLPHLRGHVSLDDLVALHQERVAVRQYRPLE